MTPENSLEAIVAEENAVETAEVDVESMTDEQFSEFKEKIGGEEAKEPDPKATKEPDKATAEPDDGDEPDKDGQKRETVPHAQFHRERERRKQAEIAAQTATATATKAMERMQALLDAQRQPEQPQGPQIPDINDPVGRINWVTEQIAAQKQAEQQWQQEQRQQQEVQQVINATLNKVNADLTVAAKDDPSVNQARDYLRYVRARELQFYGYNDQQIAQTIGNEEVQHALHIADNNLDIGDYLKGLAGTRGWVYQEQKEQKTETEADKIAKREQARQAGQSLGKGGGAVVNTGEITPEALLDMSDEEFDAYKKKHGSVARAFAA